MGYAFSTRCLYGNANVQEKSDRTKALTMPIYQTATFAHAGVGKSTGYDYTRSQNPTREYVEDVVNSLEGGCGALALATGMAAITVTMELFKPGDHIIAGSDLYGGTTRSFEQINMKNGIIVEHVDTDDVNKVEAAIKDNTRGIFIETPSNPLMRVTDVRKLCEMIKGRNILLIADNTFLTPYYMRPLELGADIVIHSGTKYLGGHNDTEAGFIVAKSREIFERLRFIMNTTGPVLSPFDSFLV
ncbi:MAG: aminotransferase class I/II-fold pyridoxal phosphate-dependent enzyme, partial [Lachnospiraceae bacterium]|nr:aminotransferase class I/II-fold pyridoxal phosphate-dependent enzyme [Lachnospiraceae bacterium]